MRTAILSLTGRLSLVLFLIQGIGCASTQRIESQGDCPSKWKTKEYAGPYLNDYQRLREFVLATFHRTYPAGHPQGVVKLDVDTGKSLCRLLEGMHEGPVVAVLGEPLFKGKLTGGKEAPFGWNDILAPPNDGCPSGSLLLFFAAEGTGTESAVVVAAFALSGAD
jgi:hypothetical protein